MNTERIFPIAQFAARTRNADVLAKASSGGLFSELAKETVSRGGVVYGAAWSSAVDVKHIRVTESGELHRLRGSKYVVSDMRDVYAAIDNDIKSGALILFSGTPCQVAAIKRRFGKYDRLVLCAVVCRSQLPKGSWLEYCRSLERESGSRIASFDFRDKKSGWRDSTMIVRFENGTATETVPWHGSRYAQLFLQDYETRECCFNCAFRAGHSGADIVVGDFWGISGFANEFDDDRGVNVVLIYTERGRRAFEALNVKKMPVSYAQAVSGNTAIEKSPLRPVGLLTFHSQLNYGGVLQAVAMQGAIDSLGYRTVVLDRWLDGRNASLVGPYKFWGLRGWIKFILRFVCGCVSFGVMLRHLRTFRYVKRKMRLSAFHFRSWSEVSVPIKRLVVGSDQVWNCKWNDPGAYLLEGRAGPPAVAYAASFGMRQIPAEMQKRYSAGLARFKAISCREQEGVKMCENLGFYSECVVDPTLLVPRDFWPKARRNRKIVCYFVGQDVNKALRSIRDFSRRARMPVDVLVDSWPEWYRLGRSGAGVHVLVAAGPDEFLNAFASSAMCVTDSFHALMFSSVYNLNIRFLRPRSELRRQMFARVEEFVSSCCEGEVVVEDVESALRALEQEAPVTFKHDVIEARRKHSFEWLRRSLS